MDSELNNPSIVIQAIIIFLNIVGFFPCIGLLLVYYLGKRKIKISTVGNSVLVILCIIHNISYILPNSNNKSYIICHIQTLFLYVSELYILYIITGIVVVEYQNFQQQEMFLKWKKRYFIILVIIGIVFPSICVCLFLIFGNIQPDPVTFFCWFTNIYCLIGIALINLFSFIILFFCICSIRSKLKRFATENSGEIEIIQYARQRTDKYAYILYFFLLTFLVNLLGIIFEECELYSVMEWVEPCGEITDSLVCTLFIIFYGFDQKKYQELKDILCCNQKKDYLLNEEKSQTQRDIDIRKTIEKNMTIDFSEDYTNEDISKD